MKNILLTIITLIATISSAGACEHSAKNLVCPGDEVIVVLDPNSIEMTKIRLAKIVGINAHKKEAVYTWFGMFSVFTFIGNHHVQESRWWNSNTSIDLISVKYGCVLGACVKDQVVYKNTLAEIIAVNPYTKKVIVSTAHYFHEVDPLDLASTSECADYGPEARSADSYFLKN